MGKNARLREERKQTKEAREAAKLVEQKKQKRKRVITTCIASVVAVAVVAGVLLGLFFGVIVNQGWYLRRVTAMETENFSISGAMMSYLIYNSYENYSSSYGDSLGIDSEKALKDQMFQENATWFDYFALEAETNWRQVLLFAEKAKESGMALTTDEEASIATEAASYDFSAYTDMFGFTVEDFMEVMRISTLASKFYDKTVTDLAIDNKKIEDYFKTNEKYFKMVDYKVISIPYGANGWYADAATAKSAADYIAKATTATAFDSAVKEVLSAIGASASDIETELANAKMIGNYYRDDDAVCTWAFGSAKVNSTYVADTGSEYVVYQLLTTPYIDETTTVDVRHILVSDEDKAKEVLAEWKKGDATADSFGELAKKYTEDTGSAETGGLYENVNEGEMVEAFDTWIFAENRKVGDTDIVKTDYGYHVMYFQGKGDVAWQINAEQAIISEAIDKLCAEIQEVYPLTVKGKVIARLPI